MTFPYRIVSKRELGNSGERCMCIGKIWETKRKKRRTPTPSNVRKRYFGWSKCAVFVIREATKDKGNLPSLSSRLQMPLRGLTIPLNLCTASSVKLDPEPKAQYGVNQFNSTLFGMYTRVIVKSLEKPPTQIHTCTLIRSSIPSLK